jgi:hypothetical protein
VQVADFWALCSAGSRCPEPETPGREAIFANGGQWQIACAAYELYSYEGGSLMACVRACDDASTECAEHPCSGDPHRSAHLFFSSEASLTQLTSIPLRPCSIGVGRAEAEAALSSHGWAIEAAVAALEEVPEDAVSPGEELRRWLRLRSHIHSVLSATATGLLTVFTFADCRARTRCVIVGWMH